MTNESSSLESSRFDHLGRGLTAKPNCRRECVSMSKLVGWEPNGQVLCCQHRPSPTACDCNKKSAQFAFWAAKRHKNECNQNLRRRTLSLPVNKRLKKMVTLVRVLVVQNTEQEHQSNEWRFKPEQRTRRVRQHAVGEELRVAPHTLSHVKIAKVVVRCANAVQISVLLGLFEHEEKLVFTEILLIKKKDNRKRKQIVKERGHSEQKGDQYAALLYIP